MNITFVVDPTTAEDVVAFLEENNWHLNGILCTHHHWDHVGGNKALAHKYNCQVYGCVLDNDRIPAITNSVNDGDEIIFGNNSKAKIYYIPGHTSHHIMYYFPVEKILFTGDTLFSMGCGRIFEGTYEEMYDSLNKIKLLPHETMIYCGHEYTMQNGLFAMHLFPDNKDIQKRIKIVKNLIMNGHYSIPIDIKTELVTNPFLLAQNLEEFIEFRQAKDVF